MSSQNVAVRKDVYDMLRREKRPHESFTQLFLRLLRQRGPLEELEASWGTASLAPAMREWRRIRYGADGGAGRR
jgi:predicted CopG family antitoxin